MSTRLKRRSWFALAPCVGLSQYFGLSSLSPAWCAEPTQGWKNEVTAGPFQIHADYSLTAKSEIASELDGLSRDVTELLQITSPKSILHVVIFGTESEYRRYMGHYYPDVPQRRALFIQERGAGILFAHSHAELATDLRHESVHALLNDSSQALPLWLDEGLAEYFEVPQASRWNGHAHLVSVKSLVGSAPCPELDELEKWNDVGLMSTDDYRDAWSWIHFLMHRRKSTRMMLLEYLHSARRGKTVAPLSRSVAMQMPEWRTEYIEHFRQVPT